MTVKEAMALRGGDEVYWNDPDDGMCSKYITINTIEYIGDGAVCIQGADGSVLECYVKELE